MRITTALIIAVLGILFSCTSKTTSAPSIYTNAIAAACKDVCRK